MAGEMNPEFDGGSLSDASAAADETNQSADKAENLGGNGAISGVANGMGAGNANGGDVAGTFLDTAWDLDESDASGCDVANDASMAFADDSNSSSKGSDAADETREDPDPAGACTTNGDSIQPGADDSIQAGVDDSSQEGTDDSSSSNGSTAADGTREYPDPAGACTANGDSSQVGVDDVKRAVLTCLSCHAPLHAPPSTSNDAEGKDTKQYHDVGGGDEDGGNATSRAPPQVKREDSKFQDGIGMSHPLLGTPCCRRCHDAALVVEQSIQQDISLSPRDKSTWKQSSCSCCAMAVESDDGDDDEDVGAQVRRLVQEVDVLLASTYDASETANPAGAVTSGENAAEGKGLAKEETNGDSGGAEVLPTTLFLCDHCPRAFCFHCLCTLNDAGEEGPDGSDQVEAQRKRYVREEQLAERLGATDDFRCPGCCPGFPSSLPILLSAPQDQASTALNSSAVATTTVQEEKKEDSPSMGYEVGDKYRSQGHQGDAPQDQEASERKSANDQLVDESVSEEELLADDLIGCLSRLEDRLEICQTFLERQAQKAEQLQDDNPSTEAEEALKLAQPATEWWSSHCSSVEYLIADVQDALDARGVPTEAFYKYRADEKHAKLQQSADEAELARKCAEEELDRKCADDELDRRDASHPLGQLRGSYGYTSQKPVVNLLDAPCNGYDDGSEDESDSDQEEIRGSLEADATMRKSYYEVEDLQSLDEAIYYGTTDRDRKWSTASSGFANKSAEESEKEMRRLFKRALKAEEKQWVRFDGQQRRRRAKKSDCGEGGEDGSLLHYPDVRIKVKHPTKSQETLGGDSGLLQNGAALPLSSDSESDSENGIVFGDESGRKEESASFATASSPLASQGERKRQLIADALKDDRFDADSERPDGQQKKKRRIQPTLVVGGSTGQMAQKSQPSPERVDIRKRCASGNLGDEDDKNGPNTRVARLAQPRSLTPPPPPPLLADYDFVDSDFVLNHSEVQTRKSPGPPGRAKLESESENDNSRDSAPMKQKGKVTVAQHLAKVLKPHQREGIQFMWNNVCTSVQTLREHPPGLVAPKSDTIDLTGPEILGCILAHNMGLGKSLQTVAFVHTLLCHPELFKPGGSKENNPLEDRLFRRVILCVPVNTLANWENEFTKWLSEPEGEKLAKKRRNALIGVDGDKWQGSILDLGCIRVFLPNKAKGHERDRVVKHWFQCGGILLASFDILKKLINTVPTPSPSRGPIPFKAKDVNMLRSPGADLLIVDEGHQALKNSETEISKALYSVDTSRRIVLTGTPFQNNLKEYYTMANWVRSGCLGSENDFERDYIQPILQGSNADSSTDQVVRQQLLTRALFRMLQPFVHRRDSQILRSDLPPIQQAVIVVRQTKQQQHLYRGYKRYQRESHTKNFLEAYAKLRPVFNHPGCLLMRPEKESTESQEEMGGYEEKNGQNWWHSTFEKYPDMEDMKAGRKIVVLLNILAQADEIGDKVVVFSQCLRTLDYIERALNTTNWELHVSSLRKVNENRQWGPWRKNFEYLRIDGGVNATTRGDLISSFNGLEPKAFLISTKAGGIGINLVAANRVVILDTAWNPAIDLQALYRCYRYGQTKPVYAYRLLAEGTMEEKIYSRQVNKTSLALRVVDQNNPTRNFTAAEVEDLMNNDNWVQCDSCEKWRMLPPEVDALPGEKDKWFCHMNVQDSARADCSAEEKDRKFYHDFFQRRLFHGGEAAAMASENATADADKEDGDEANCDAILNSILALGKKIVSSHHFHDALLEDKGNDGDLPLTPDGAAAMGGSMAAFASPGAARYTTIRFNAETKRSPFPMAPNPHMHGGSVTDQAINLYDEFDEDRASSQGSRVARSADIIEILSSDEEED